jgi:hypothetical protein
MGLTDVITLITVSKCTKCTCSYLILVREAQVGILVQRLHVFDEADQWHRPEINKT